MLEGHSLGELAVRFGLELRGEPDLRVSRAATLAQAGPGTLSFLGDTRYRRLLAGTQASAVVLSAADSVDCPVAALIASNPKLAFARILGVLHPQQQARGGIHPSAVIDVGAVIAPSASIGPHCVIEAGVHIGERVRLGGGCIVLSGSHVGDDSRLVARVTLYPQVSIGKRCVLHAGAVVGSDGFGFAHDADAWIKIPQVGTVRIGDDVEIGANTCVDRGAIEDTVIEDGVKLDNQIQVGHNVVIGAHTAIAACTGISGSTVIGKRCMIGGMVGFAGHLQIADDVIVTGCSLVSASIRNPGSYSSGMPTVESRAWRRMVAHLRRFGEKER